MGAAPPLRHIGPPPDPIAAFVLDDWAACCFATLGVRPVLTAHAPPFLSPATTAEHEQVTTLAPQLRTTAGRWLVVEVDDVADARRRLWASGAISAEEALAPAPGPPRAGTILHSMDGAIVVVLAAGKTLTTV